MCFGSAGIIKTKQGTTNINFPTSFNHIKAVVVSSSHGYLIISRTNVTASGFTFGWRYYDGSTGSIADTTTSYIAVGH